MRSVAIVGTGLIGASFGLALRRAGFQGSITGVSGAPALAEAVRIGLQALLDALRPALELRARFLAGQLLLAGLALVLRVRGAWVRRTDADEDGDAERDQAESGRHR